jgi:hypothetical protein
MKLTKEELSSMKNLNTEYVNVRNLLADIEIEKIGIADRVKALRSMIQSEEKKIIKKYGDTSVINMDTGEVTNKKKE